MGKHQMESEVSSNNTSTWYVFGHHIPKQEVVFFTQVIILYLVIITSVINLSLHNGDPTLWSTLLGSCLGYVLPNPTIKRKTIVQPPATV